MSEFSGSYDALVAIERHLKRQNGLLTEISNRLGLIVILLSFITGILIAIALFR